MFKSILYYILMIAEFCSTMFVGGIVIGIYLAVSGKLEEVNANDQASFLKAGTPIIYVSAFLLCLYYGSPSAWQSFPSLRWAE